MTTILENFQNLRAQIKKAERTHNRGEGTTNLVAVTKTQSQTNLLAALLSGHRLFGENKVQEAQDHWTELKTQYSDIALHLIGPLQSNKTAEAVALFDVIETLDREKLAIEISKENKKQGRDIECFIQVNTGEESQKAGIIPDQLLEFVKFSRHDCALNVTGLMCIPPVTEPPALHFAFLKKLALKNNLENLSMGMSADYKKAVALGATHVRIGSALFGERV